MCKAPVFTTYQKPLSDPIKRAYSFPRHIRPSVSDTMMIFNLFIQDYSRLQISPCSFPIKLRQPRRKLDYSFIAPKLCPTSIHIWEIHRNHSLDESNLHLSHSKTWKPELDLFTWLIIIVVITGPNLPCTQPLEPYKKITGASLPIFLSQYPGRACPIPNFPSITKSPPIDCR